MSAVTGIQINPSSAVAPTSNWTTPQLLRGAWLGTWAADALLLIVIVNATYLHRHSMQAIGKDTAPSIIAAQTIKTAIADMDANLADEFIALSPTQERDARVAFVKEQSQAAEAIIGAAENITYGDAERVPIKTLTKSTGDYLMRVQRARDLRSRNDPAANAEYRESARIVDETLLPAADALDEANNTELEKTYSRDVSFASVGRSGVVFAGVLLIGLLVGVQMFLLQRMHRLINPALLAATLLALAIVIFSFSALQTEARELDVVRKDAFVSIRALRQAKAIAYQAHAAESRYLLGGNTAVDQRLFDHLAGMLLHTPTGSSFKGAIERASRGEKVPTEAYSGLLVYELNNITFPGERSEAVHMANSFTQYLDADTAIRAAVEERNDRKSAIAGRFAVSNVAFAQFDRALDRTLDINHREFDRAVAAGFDAVRGLEAWAGVFAVLIAGLIFAGLMPRMREYRG